MPAPKFEKDGSPRISIRDRILHALGDLSAEQAQTRIVLLDLWREIQESNHVKIGWSGFYKAYDNLQEDQKNGVLPPEIHIPELLETHSRGTRRRVAELRVQDVPHADIAQQLGISRGRSLAYASEERVTRTHVVVTSEELDTVAILLRNGYTEEQIMTRLDLTPMKLHVIRTRLSRPQKNADNTNIDAKQLAADHGRSSRRRKVRSLLLSGFSPKEVSEHVGSSLSNVQRIAREEGLSHAKEPLTEEELAQVADAWNNQNMRRGAIAKALNMSYNRVRYALSVLRERQVIVDKKQEQLSDEELVSVSLAWNHQNLTEQAIVDKLGIGRNRVHYILEVLRERKQLIERKPEKEIKRRDAIIVNLAKQGLSSIEISAVLREGWDIDLTNDQVTARLGKLRKNGKLPQLSKKKDYEVWRNEQKTLVPEQMMRRASEIKAKLLSFLREGGRISFVTDNGGFEIFRIAAKPGREPYEQYAATLLEDYGRRLSPSPINYVRNRRQDGSYVASLIFNAEAAGVLYDSKSGNVTYSGSPHANILLRTLEYLRSTYLLQAAYEYKAYEFPEDMVPSVSDILREVIQGR